MDFNKVYCADSLEFLDQIPENSIDLIVTDPPYGLEFFGKDWDKAVPSVEIWKKCLKVLKPGAFAFVMSAPRQDVLSRMIVNLEEAGFRTDFTSTYWTFATGFPKASAVAKSIDRKLGIEPKVVGVKQNTYDGCVRDPSKHKSPAELSNIGEWGLSKTPHGMPLTEAVSEKAKAVEGGFPGYNPKPAVEVILTVMKPLFAGSYLEQAMDNGKGITYLDYCRIPYKDKDDMSSATPQGKCISKKPGVIGAEPDAGRNIEKVEFERPELKGRFPANLLVSNDILDDGIERKSNRCDKPSDCGGNTWGGTIQTNRGPRGYDDAGSFSRYFDIDRWWEDKMGELPEEVRKTLPFMIVSKVCKSERQKGLRKIVNNHPTVKPIKLLSYLITLGSKKEDVVLDPFSGSGTTGMAAVAFKRKFIGIEKERDYADMANERIDSVKKEMESFFDYEEE